MKKLMKKLAAVGAAALLTFGTVTAASAARVISEKIIARTSSYNMDLYSVEGGRLLFNSAYDGSEYAGGTSKFYVGVDGSFSTLSTSNDVADDASLTITGSTSKNGVDITKRVRIISNSVDGAKDTAEFTMILTNNSEVNHTICGRIFLDTMVENNDNAPFRVAGIGSITKRLQLEGDAIPAYFQAFNKLTDPTMIGTGTFATGSGRPDIVQFTNYYADSYTLIPPCDSTADTGDSAVNAIWKERTLAPGQTFTCTTYYGLGMLDINAGSELVLAGTRTSTSFTINEDGTGYNPIALTGYVTNAGINTLSGVAMYLEVPAGISGGSTGVGYPSLAVGEEQQNTWYLEATPTPEERTVTVTINAESAETGKITPVVYTFIIPAIAGADPIEEPTTVPEPVTTAPVTTEPVTTVAPTTVAATTNPDATSGTKPAPASKDQATPSQATPEQPAAGTVKTGEAVPAAIILTTLLAGVGVVYFMKKKDR